MKKGILLKPKHEPDTTKFKLCVWYDKKPNGEHYTQFEKESNKNRKYHDSIDYILTPLGYVTRHDEALNKLLHHVEKYKANIIRALLYVNDHINDKQYLIGKFERDETKSQFIQPLFKHYDKIQYTEKIIETNKTVTGFEIQNKTLSTSQVFYSGLLAQPLSEYKLRRYKTL